MFGMGPMELLILGLMGLLFVALPGWLIWKLVSKE